MSTAYNSKILKFPIDNLKNLLLYTAVEDVYADCKYFGVMCNENEEYAQFQKGNFCDNKTDVSNIIKLVTNNEQ